MSVSASGKVLTRILATLLVVGKEMNDKTLHNRLLNIAVEVCKFLYHPPKLLLSNQLTNVSGRFNQNCSS